MNLYLYICTQSSRLRLCHNQTLEQETIDWLCFGTDRKSIMWFDIVNEYLYFVVNKVITNCSEHTIGWNRTSDLLQPIAWLQHFFTTLFTTKYKFSFTMSKNLIYIRCTRLLSLSYRLLLSRKQTLDEETIDWLCFGTDRKSNNGYKPLQIKMYFPKYFVLLLRTFLIGAEEQ